MHAEPKTLSRQPRQPTPLDAVAESYLDRMAALSPLTATEQGLVGHDREMDDLSPEGHESRAEAARQALRTAENTPAADAVDRVTRAAMAERLGLAVERFEAGDHLADLNNIASPLQAVRDVFDLMASDTVDDWETIAVRLSKIPQALAGYRASLARGAETARTPAARQVRIGIAQARELAAEGSFFDQLAATGGAADRLDGRAGGTASSKSAQQVVTGSLAADLVRGAAEAREAYGELADFLEGGLLDRAPERDGVGRERYERASRDFLGSRVDFEETYEWGLAEVERIAAEQLRIAEEIGGAGTGVEEAFAILDGDEDLKLRGTEALQRWMTEVSGAALAGLDGNQFDIPEPLLRLECRIAPTQNGGIYYTGPSEDFSRPGRMWWSVPPSVTEFSTWRERTTVYHEGVPGHHLQVGQTACESERLNRWRRFGVWVSGHGEGWALYAERLMDEFGFLPTPGDRLGMLDGQRMRACRVVVDLGVHLGLACPDAWGGGVWDEPRAWRYLNANLAQDPAFLRFELDRYLGWPGQAPAYKIGQRLWEQARADAAARARATGQDFDLKAFHSQALALGSLGLDTLTEALAGSFD
ncbi:MAG: DUF885 domain-containing protein [Bifidobacteriaceae bacterium]|jgi:uncharacterized protein (DUF885 family)|nr:DUF885 domain-containing protein [Bifidobacteriaceae bacterium]